jgi:peptidoglycan/xylan/chitin deacetylase (PgdA/CDA1 family)
VSLRSLLGGARRQMLCALHQRLAPLGHSGPMISFTFDDFPRTALTAGGAILEGHGFRGTYYTAMGLKNTTGELGDQFRAEDLYALLERGHELASHTFGHISSRKVSCEAFCADVARGCAALEDSTGARPANFAYPFGDVSFACKRSLLGAESANEGAGNSARRDDSRKDHSLTSARGIIPGLNGPKIDLNLLRANSLYGDLDQAEAAKILIAENSRRNAWLIFYTHDVRPNPSRYGCTPELLESVAACAAQSGARVLTIAEALAEAGIRNGNPKVQARNYAPV